MFRGLIRKPSLTNAGRLLLALALSSSLLITAGETLDSKAASADPISGANARSPYWIANAAGQVWNFGTAPDYGDLSGVRLNKPIVAMAKTPSNAGYYLVATDGGIFTFGDAHFYGSTGSVRLNKPIVGMTPTPSNRGYWMVASDGGIFTFGDAAFYGSTGSVRLNKPIVGMAASPSGHGYWLFAGDGGIFTFGDAGFYGSTGSVKLAKPISAMTPTPSGRGYWLVANDGGIFSFGDARFYGSAGGGSDASFSKIVTTPDGKGYWLMRSGGDSIAYGAAVNAARPMVDMFQNITGPGDIALSYALAQLGKPYAWGATGPNSFDCSGLTQKAWAAAGTPINRIAADQWLSGTRLPLAQAKAGDLVFWATNAADYTSIYHVAVYAGSGNIVDAPKTGDVVKTRALWTADLVGTVVRPRS